MMRNTITKSALLATGLMLSVQSSAEPTAEALGYTCAGCHGTNGASTGNAIPSLAGLSEGYLIGAMNAYREDERSSTIMGRIAKGYTEEQIESMATFFSAQPVHANINQKYDATKARAGAKLHDKYCSSCHTEAGAEPEDDAGLLSGNSKLFMKYTLADFHDGSRDMPKRMEKKMKKMLKKDPDALGKLVNYYGSGK
jgi:cytochrome subunit of sulfide dehydrogenase